MKVEFGTSFCPAPASVLFPALHAPALHAYAASETDRLTDVIVCAPHHLEPVPCCAVTRRNLQKGFTSSTGEALAQHETLSAMLQKHGVRCHELRASPDLPDMCFTRDIGVATPFGLVALRPAMAHRRGETGALLRACTRWNIPVSAIARGEIEGGDVCVAREGLLILGLSGERSTPAGVQEFAAPFRAAGWEVLTCSFHPDHLHLDTIFCMLAGDEAIGCVELLDPRFVLELKERGVRILSVPAGSAATLGCNILALGDRRIIASAGDAAVAATLGDAGYLIETVDVSQFTACGGGIHCLTQPLRRVAA